MLKRIAIVLLAAILLIALTACEDKVDKMDAQQVLDEAIAQMAKIANYKYTFDIKAAEYAEPIVTDAPVFEDPDVQTDMPDPEATGDISMEPISSESLEPLPLETPEPTPSPSPDLSASPSPSVSVALGDTYGLSNQSIVFNSPLMTKVTSNMSLKNGNETDAEAVFSQEGTDYYMYNQLEGQWVRLRLASDKVVNEYFKFYYVDCMAYLKDYMKDIVKAGKEKIGEMNCLKLTAKLSPDVLPMVLYQSWLPLSTDTAKQLGDMDISIWVDIETMDIVRIYLDMTENVNILKDETDKSGNEESEDNPDESKITLVYASVTLECVFSDYGTNEQPTVPPDAQSQPAADFNPYGTGDEESS